MAEQRHKFAREDIQRNTAQRDQRSESLFDPFEPDSVLLRRGGVWSRSQCGQGGSLAFYQFAEVLLNASVFALVLFFADGAGLVAQFQAKQCFLQLIKAALHFAV